MKKATKLIYRKKLRPYEVRNLWLSRIFIWISILVTMFPILWVIGASLSAGDAFFSGSVFPKAITFKNYTDILFKPGEVGMDFFVSLKNSFILCTSVAIIQVIITSTAAYAFSRMRFTGRKYGLMSLLILQMFPATMSMVAIVKVLYDHNWIDYLWPLIVLFSAGSAFSVWLLKNFIDGIPKELDEVAKVDGANHWQIFTKIILPLARPMIAVMMFFSFIGTYNEFIMSSIVLQSPEKYTMMISLQTFVSGNFDKHWTQFSAAAILASLPLMILFMLMQNLIEKGLAAGAVKG
jgi:arabinogalactan oligomer/maltooligosaccharide transport system permease protein